MADQFTEQSIEEEVVVNRRAPIETAAKIMASPDHPQWTADRAVAKELAQGQSGLIAAIDGVGSGGEISAQAAEVIRVNLGELEEQLVAPPTINKAVTLLKDAIFGATPKIKELQRKGRNSDVDTTVSAGIVCESIDRKRRFLVSANVGDSRLYRYRLGTGEVVQLTVDHSIVQSLVAAGEISSDQAFTDPRRNIVYRTVGLLGTPNDIDFRVTEIQDGDIFLALSDGVHDNIPPRGLPVAVRSEFQAAFNPTQQKPDLRRFASGFAQRARNIQGTKAGHAKKDDICVAVLRVPRAK